MDKKTYPKCPNQTGTSCQATIAPSLRDIWQEPLDGLPTFGVSARVLAWQPVAGVDTLLEPLASLGVILSDAKAALVQRPQVIWILLPIRRKIQLNTEFAFPARSRFTSLPPCKEGRSLDRVIDVHEYLVTNSSALKKELTRQESGNLLLIKWDDVRVHVLGEEVFAGIDLRHTANGRWVCFEANPSPGYTFYEHATGAQITKALRDLLRRGRTVSLNG